jgi:hypothetical protein
VTDVALAIKVTADADDAVHAADKVGDAFDSMATNVDAAADKASAAGDKMGSVADSADNLGSSTSQAAGGLGDLGGALSAVPGPLGAVGTGMESLAPLVMGVTGATDLMSLAMNSNIVVSAKAKAASVAQAAATVATTVATKAAAAGQWALNAAMSANPIGAVVVLIVALVAGLVLAYNKSDTFREVVDKAFDVAKKAIDPVVNVTKDIAGALQDGIDKVGGVGPAFEVMKTLVVGYIDLVTLPLRTVVSIIDSIIDKLSHIKLPHIPGTRVSARGDDTDLSRLPTDGSAPGGFLIYAPVIVNGYVGSEVQLARLVAPALEAAIRRVRGPKG